MPNFSQYENYNYVSPAPIYARIKLELSTFFDSGAIDDLLFPLYTEEAIKKFRKSFLKLETTCLQICNYSALLPENFNKVREAWLSVPVYAGDVDFVTYQVKDYAVQSCSDYESSCADGSCGNSEDYISVSIPDNAFDAEFLAVHKITSQVLFAYNRDFLLKPGNIHAQQCCDDKSPNRGCNSATTFDIRDGKMVTNFSDGTVHLLYYSTPITEEGYPLVPDDYFVQDYLYKYLRARIFENLRHLSGPETYNQSMTDYQLAQKEADIAWATLSSESKKWTVEKTFNRIKRSLNQHNRYRIR